MDTESQTILERARQRFEVLRAIYIDTGGQKDKISVSSEISKKVGLPHKDLIPILQYLKDEELIHPLSMLCIGNERIPIQLLHKGILEVEAAISTPNEPTEHFPSQAFNFYGDINATHSAFQIGDQNTLNFRQHSSLVESALEIQQLLKQLEKSYPKETFVEKAILAEEARKQIDSNPNLKGKIVSVLKTVSMEAFKEAVDHPLVNIFMAAIESWKEEN